MPAESLNLDTEEKRKCFNCDGKGHVNKNGAATSNPLTRKCLVCKGTGKVDRVKTVPT